MMRNTIQAVASSLDGTIYFGTSEMQRNITSRCLDL
jgi:hypothetical protein